MKKLISLLLALMMVLSLATVAFATEGGITPNPNGTNIQGNSQDNKGSITINKYNKENNYILYRMLELESFDTSGTGIYSYKIMPGWEEFFASPYVQEYVTVENNYVRKKTTFTDAVAPGFAQEALKYIEDKKSNTNPEDDIKPVVSSNKADAMGTTLIGNVEFPYYKFSNLQLGYYLVDSTMGALCGLTTTNLDASINAKNGEPTLDKYVYDEAKGEWDLSSTANIGDIVKYRTIITVQAGAEDYIFHDKMSSGLTFKGVTSITFDGLEIPNTNYSVHYNCDISGCVCKSCKNNCTFHIVFNSDYCKTLAANKSLVIYYEAILNENAKIAEDGETNTAKLEFGEDHFTTEKTVNTRTYAFDLVKTDGQNFLLDGAKFTLWIKTGVDNQNNNTYAQVGLIKVVTNDNNTPADTSDDTFYYRPAVGTETASYEPFEVEDGLIRFQGFAPGDYYFEETEAPHGYNELTDKAKFTLSAANKDAIFNADTTNPTIKIYSAGSGFHITNQSGAMLPETGATGTTMFIFFGMFVMLTTGVLLVTKKRMSMIEE